MDFSVFDDYEVDGQLELDLTSDTKSEILDRPTDRPRLILGNCIDEIKKLPSGKYIIVTDPPFNVGYHYNTYSDRMKDSDYFKMLKDIFSSLDCPYVVIHYPESLYRIAIEMNQTPNRVVSWVYNSNTKRQHRDIAFWGINPIFSQVKQPYKNPKDKRVAERIKNGSKGTDLYDWWNVNQVKNVSKEKTIHPCQMPLEVMENVIGILPSDYTIIDCFMGSGTTGVACKNLGRKFIGIEMDEKYFEIAKKRIES